MSLALAGVWLLAVGTADLGSLTARGHGVAHRAAWLGLGALAGAVVLLVVPLPGSVRTVVWVVGALLLAAWVLAPAPAVRAAGLTLGLVGAVLAGGLVCRDRAWPGWLEGTVLAEWSTTAVLVGAGVLLAQVTTANLVVRLLLDAVGVPATTNEKQLRGGRVLGPMERVFLVALGALGELTAAAVVIAAKGLLRFPELQRAQRTLSGLRGADGAELPGVGGPTSSDGPSDVTEYFLIGSLASWLLALAGAGLVHLATR